MSGPTLQAPVFTDIQNRITELHDKIFPETKRITPEDSAFLRSFAKKVLEPAKPPAPNEKCGVCGGYPIVETKTPTVGASPGPMGKQSHDSPADRFVKGLEERRKKLLLDPEYTEYVRLLGKFKELR